jgi:hypothetical protein
MKQSRGYVNSDPREKTIHLAEKLIRIRTALGLSQKGCDLHHFPPGLFGATVMARGFSDG